MQQFKLLYSDKDRLLPFFSAIVDSYDNGGCYVTCDLKTIVHKYVSYDFDIKGMAIGADIQGIDIFDNVFQSNQVQVTNLDKISYGVNIRVLAGPFWSDDYQEVVGAWLIAVSSVPAIVEAFDTFAPLLINMFPEGGILYLVDDEKVIKRQGTGNYDLKHMGYIGQNIDELPITKKAVLTGQDTKMDIPASLHGFPAIAVGTPIKDHKTGELVGALGLALPRTLMENLKNMADNLGKGLGNISATMEQMAASASEVSQQQSLLHKEIGDIEIVAREINQVLALIKDIAEQTKMLGLNAAIEAARAGDAGRGFGVVSEEIRKLSDQSKQTVVEIRELINSINKSLETTLSASKSTLVITEQQAAGTEEVNASVEEMTALSEQLDTLARQL